MPDIIDNSVDTTMYDWYIWPYLNGSTPFYTTNSTQDYDLNQCVYSSFYKLPITNANFILGEKQWTYFGFWSGAFCLDPSNRDAFDFLFQPTD